MTLLFTLSQNGYYATALVLTIFALVLIFKPRRKKYGNKVQFKKLTVPVKIAATTYKAKDLNSIGNEDLIKLESTIEKIWMTEDKGEFDFSVYQLLSPILSTETPKGVAINTDIYKEYPLVKIIQALKIIEDTNFFELISAEAITFYVFEDVDGKDFEITIQEIKDGEKERKTKITIPGISKENAEIVSNTTYAF